MMTARVHTASPEPHVIAVAHGGLIRTVISHVTAGEYPEPGHKLANGSAHTFVMERERLRLIDSPALAPL